MAFKITRKAPKNNASTTSAPPERAPGLVGVFKRHVKFLGPGIVASAAYYDPGNWATDLQAGSRFGNAHLFILLLAVCIAVFLQILATRLGYITRKDISQNCRQALYSQGKPSGIASRWLMLYPLWLIFELGILFADLGELLGSATALILLFPQLPPWVAVLLTLPEVFLALLFFRNGKQSRRSVQIFEIMITVVVMAVVVSALVLFVKVKPDMAQVFRGYIPSKELISGTSFYTAIGIIGATVGPHSLILGATMATRDRDSEEVPEITVPQDEGPVIYIQPSSGGDVEKEPIGHRGLHESGGASIGSSFLVVPSPKYRSLRDCKSYLAHASFDVAASIFTLPLIVNSAILVVASTTFFYNKPADMIVDDADLPAMHSLLRNTLGAGFATLFAISLWLSGNAASLTITMAGQSISAGFLERPTSPLVRRLVTRTLGVIPAAAISATHAQKGISDLLIASQVAISIVLPFAIIPLAIFTSRRALMSISIPTKTGQLFPEEDVQPKAKYDAMGHVVPGIARLDTQLSEYHPSVAPEMKELQVTQAGRLHSFANHAIIVLFVVVLVLVILAANVYGIYQVATGG